jgi:predicted amidophosphoribosyltransferase
MIRILQVAQRIGVALSLPVAELLENKADREAQHATAQKRNIQALVDNLRYRAAYYSTRPTGILLIDDVLTTGATFTACKSVLQANLPGVPVLGVFVARRVPEAQPEGDDFGDVPEDDDW